jgi:putative aldouronate transport system permease protein
LGFDAIPFFSNNTAFLILTVATAVWAGIGSGAIVYIAALAGVDESLYEAAYIDGAGEFRTFFQIIVPLSKPIIMTLALWDAVAHWNSWFDSMMYITDNKKIVVQQYIQRIVNENATNKITDLGAGENVQANMTSETIKSASIMVTVIPILCFYPFVQRYFIKGVTLGAVKG